MYVYKVAWSFFLSEWSRVKCQWNHLLYNFSFLEIYVVLMKTLNVGKFHYYEFYVESDFSSNTLENISIMRFVSISRACLTLGAVFWRFRLSLIICPRDKRPCSSTVANTSRDFVTMVSWRAMATTVGSQKLYPGNRHSLCLSKEDRSMELWNMAFEVFIFRMLFNQSCKKKIHVIKAFYK